jgi:hypothetical protein
MCLNRVAMVFYGENGISRSIACAPVTATVRAALPRLSTGDGRRWCTVDLPFSGLDHTASIPFRWADLVHWISIGRSRLDRAGLKYVPLIGNPMA